MNKRLFLLLFCLFVVMIGFGVTLPVLPFYAKHLKDMQFSLGFLNLKIENFASPFSLSAILMFLTLLGISSLIQSHHRKLRGFSHETQSPSA